MHQNLIARADISIKASNAKVWNALVSPDAIKQYMFGTTVASDWRQGSPITWTGEYEGKHYEDKGVILQITPGRLLQYSHFSPLAGAPDLPENYHTVTISLTGLDDKTRVALTQDNNATDEACEHSAKNWRQMLDGLKQYVEG